jgi:hypothetical protein
MRIVLATAAAALAAAMAGEAAAAELVLDQAVARVVVIPEARSDIQVEVAQGRNGAPPVRVSRSGDSVTVSGGSRVRMCNFDTEDGGWIMLSKSGPRVDMEDFASVTVRAPRDVRISGGGGAILGSIGRSQTLTMEQSGCAHWTAGDVAGPLQAEMSTGANLRAGTVPTARLNATSGGAVRVVRADRLDATATAGGVIKANAAPGVVVATATGGGVVTIDGGSTRSLTGTATGGAHIRHKGRVGELEASASGGAVIKVEHAGRVLSRYAHGGSSVVINDSAN